MFDNKQTAIWSFLVILGTLLLVLLGKAFWVLYGMLVIVGLVIVCKRAEKKDKKE